VDYGRARIGLAIAESLQVIAQPLGTLKRINRNEDMRRLRELVRDNGVKLILVGLPLRLDGARSEQDLLTPSRICPLLAQRPARALNPVQSQAGEASLLDLSGQAAGGVEVGGGEELRPADRVGVAVLPVGQVALHDRPEVRVVQPALIQPIQQRGEPVPLENRIG